MHPYRHRPRKRFGQNFLHDPAILARMAAAIHPQAGERMVEIGPGLGALTEPLLRAAGCLDVVELDRDLVAPLQARCEGLGELRIHQADALTYNFAALAPQGGLRVVGNLPYNISTPLLFHLITQLHAIRDMHFLLQKEVVERMAAAPGGHEYGRLSVMLQYRCTVTPLFKVGPGAFNPPPKVDSAFVQLVPHAEPPVHIDDERAFARVVQTAFSQRRKTLRNVLRDLISDTQMRSVDIDPGWRPQQLDLRQFAALGNLLAATS